MCQLITSMLTHSHHPKQSSTVFPLNTFTTDFQNTDIFQYFHLRCPKQIHNDDIIRNLTYYGSIIDLCKESFLPNGNFSTYKATFDNSVNFKLLTIIWNVNIKGYNIFITFAHLIDQQIAYHKHYIVGFQGFFHHITECQAFYTIHLYGGLNCYFDQNITYITFKSANLMHWVC